MENSDNKRSCLRGLECTIFDLVSATEQWAEWLRVPLQHAAAAGDLRLVVQLQRAGANGNALHAAVGGGHAALVRYLVKEGTSVTEQDKNGHSPLHLAAAQGIEETVSLLLEKGAPPNALDRADRAPLHVAAENGRLAGVNVLLAAGADTSLRYGDDEVNMSALDLAAARGRVDIVTALIRSGANVNSENPYSGSTALHEAAYSNVAGVIDVLVEAGADMDATQESRGWTALHCAADGCCVEAILALLRHGVWVETPDSNGQSPLHLTAGHGHLPATEALLAAGADVDAIDNDGATALHLAASTGRHQDVSRALVQAGADVNAACSLGRTALHYAVNAMYRDAGRFRGLVEADAAVDAQDENKPTPLHLGLPPNIRLEPIAALLECGANANAQNLSGNSPLHLAASIISRKHAGDAVDLLLRWGADETAVNGSGRTPLQHSRAKFVHVNSLGRLSDLLEQAPADRNWRRRGLLLLYRAYPLRMRPIPGTDAAPSNRPETCCARVVSTEATGGENVVGGGAARAGGSASGDWSGVVAWVVGIGLEGVFRKIVKYL